MTCCSITGSKNILYRATNKLVIHLQQVVHGEKTVEQVIRMHQSHKNYVLLLFFLKIKHYTPSWLRKKKRMGQQVTHICTCNWSIPLPSSFARWRTLQQEGSQQRDMPRPNNCPHPVDSVSVATGRCHSNCNVNVEQDEWQAHSAIGTNLG